MDKQIGLNGKSKPSTCVPSLFDLCFDQIDKDFGRYQKDMYTIPEHLQRQFFERKIATKLYPLDLKKEDALPYRKVKCLVDKIKKVTHMLYAVSHCANLTVLNFFTDEIIAKFQTTEDDYITSFVALNETTIAIGTQSGTIHLWDFKKTNDKRLVHSCSIELKNNDVRYEEDDKRPAHKWGHRIVGLIKCNDSLISASRQGTIKSWNVQTGQEIDSMRISNVPLFIRGLKKINHSLCAFSDINNSVFLIDLYTKNIAELKDNDYLQTALCKIDEQTLASGDQVGNILIWDLITNKIQLKEKKHAQAIYSMRKIGNILISSSGDNSIKLWDYVNNVDVASFYNYHNPLEDPIKIMNLTLISNSASSFIHLHNLRPLLIKYYPLPLLHDAYEWLYNNKVDKSSCYKRIVAAFNDLDQNKFITPTGIELATSVPDAAVNNSQSVGFIFRALQFLMKFIIND